MKKGERKKVFVRRTCGKLNERWEEGGGGFDRNAQYISIKLNE